MQHGSKPACRLWKVVWVHRLQRLCRCIPLIALWVVSVQLGIYIDWSLFLFSLTSTCYWEMKYQTSICSFFPLFFIFMSLLFFVLYVFISCSMRIWIWSMLIIFIHLIYALKTTAADFRSNIITQILLFVDCRLRKGRNQSVLKCTIII